MSFCSSLFGPVLNATEFTKKSAIVILGWSIVRLHYVVVMWQQQEGQQQEGPQLLSFSECGTPSRFAHFLLAVLKFQIPSLQRVTTEVNI